MVKLGVMEYDWDEDPVALANRAAPWLGMNIKAAQWYSWAIDWQLRERMDWQNDIINTKVDFYQDRNMTIFDWHEHRLNEHDDSFMWMGRAIREQDELLEVVLPDHERRIAELEAELARQKELVATLEN